MRNPSTLLLAAACALGLKLAASVPPSSFMDEPHGQEQAKPMWKGPTEDMQSAIFAGGCFWCTESSFESLPGVAEVISGYTGGPEESPTYHAVSAGSTGHTEAIEVFYYPEVLPYATLVEFFWRTMDPTDLGGQFVDRGSQYRPAIFVATMEERKLAEASKQALVASKRFSKPVLCPIVERTAFFPAEEYHQDYFLKEPAHYKRYRKGSGRDRFIDKVWGADRQLNFGPLLVSPKARYTKPSDERLKSKLTSLQYKVTQRDGTEPPFKNEFWDNKREGIYVDVVSGAPLFSSEHKFKSGTGWPSFWMPLIDSNISYGVDHKLGYARDDLRSSHAGSHLGHVFDDGPAPTGKRYCINSAALRFVPADKLSAAGYARFAADFEMQKEAK